MTHYNPGHTTLYITAACNVYAFGASHLIWPNLLLPRQFIRTLTQYLRRHCHSHSRCWCCCQRLHLSYRCFHCHHCWCCCRRNLCHCACGGCCCGCSWQSLTAMLLSKPQHNHLPPLIAEESTPTPPPAPPLQTPTDHPTLSEGGGRGLLLLLPRRCGCCCRSRQPLTTVLPCRPRNHHKCFCKLQQRL